MSVCLYLYGCDLWLRLNGCQSLHGYKSKVAILCFLAYGECVVSGYASMVKTIYYCKSVVLSVWLRICNCKSMVASRLLQGCGCVCMVANLYSCQSTVASPFILSFFEGVQTNLGGKIL